MKLNLTPRVLFERFKEINGKYGLMPALFFQAPNTDDGLRFISFSGEIPKYDSLYFNHPMDIQYHLSGYGIYFEEAVIRLTGELVERYSSFYTDRLFENDFVYDSYNNLINTQQQVVPIRYYDVYTPKQKKELKTHLLIDGDIDADSKISFAKCKSLFNQEDMYIPAQLFFVGYKRKDLQAEKRFYLTFSTGTAAHTDEKKALMNALIEYIQLDAFMKAWYGGKTGQRVNLDNPIITKILNEANVQENYNITVVKLEAVIDLPVFVTILKRKNHLKDKSIPKLTFGIQGDADPAQAVYRSIMEALSITKYTRSIPVYNHHYYESSIRKDKYFIDLDSNVIKFAYGDMNWDEQELYDGSINLSELSTVSSGDTTQDLKGIVKQLKTVCPNTCYLDVTSPEVYKKGWRVIRVFIPELLSMCLPSYPFMNHPSLKECQVKDVPHPLP